MSEVKSPLDRQISALEFMLRQAMMALDKAQNSAYLPHKQACLDSCVRSIKASHDLSGRVQQALISANAGALPKDEP